MTTNLLFIKQLKPLEYLIKSQLLCQLSYAPTVALGNGWHARAGGADIAGWAGAVEWGRRWVCG